MNPAGFASAVAHAVRDAPRLTARQRALENAHWARVRNAETTYAMQLRKVARHVGDLVRQAGDEISVVDIVTMLQRYAALLDPWARAAAGRMIAEVARRDERAWRLASQRIGRSLWQEIAGAPIGDQVRLLLAEQVHYITSLPMEAAVRVQELALEGASSGSRYPEITREIMRTGHVTIGRANLIARTETARAQSVITQVRARHVGSTHFVWRTARDADVRRAHRVLEGTIHAWDDPPVAEDNGDRHLPGAFPNCRCYSEPVLPAVIE